MISERMSTVPALPGSGLRLGIQRGCGSISATVTPPPGLSSPGLEPIGCGDGADVDIVESNLSSLSAIVNVGLGGRGLKLGCGGLPSLGLGLVGCGDSAGGGTRDTTSSNIPGIDVDLGFLCPGNEDRGKIR